LLRVGSSQSNDVYAARNDSISSLSTSTTKLIGLSKKRAFAFRKSIFRAFVVAENGLSKKRAVDLEKRAVDFWVTVSIVYNGYVRINWYVPRTKICTECGVLRRALAPDVHLQDTFVGAFARSIFIDYKTNG
jgi:hypothetical protein